MQTGLAIQDHPHRNSVYIIHHGALVAKSAQKILAQDGNDLWCNPAGDIDSTGRAGGQRQITGLGAVDAHEQVQCLLRKRVALVQGSLGNGRRRIAGLHGLRHSCRFGCGATRTQECIQTHESRARKDQLIRSMAVLAKQVARQVELQFVHRPEIRAPTLGWDHCILIALPDKNRLPQAGTGTDQRTRSARHGFALLQHNKIGSPQHR